MLDKGRVRAPGEVRILFEGDNAARQSGGEGRFVPRTGADDKRRIGGFDASLPAAGEPRPLAPSDSGLLPSGRSSSI